MRTLAHIKRHLLLPLCLLGGFPLLAQPKAVATITPTRVVAGDSFALRILVSGTNVAPKAVSLAPWYGHCPPANILSQTGWQKSGAQWRQDFTLIAFDSATWDLPPLYIRTHLGDSVPTNALRLEVVPPFAEQLGVGDMSPARDIRREAAHWSDDWPWALAILALCAAVFWAWRKKRARVKPAPIAEAVPPPVPFSVITLQRLEAMEREQIWKHGSLPDFFTDLSLVVRTYLEHRFAIPATESTTYEIMGMLPKQAFPDSLKGALKEVLSQADRVKYARSEPAKEAPLQSIRKAKFLVEQLG